MCRDEPDLPAESKALLEAGWSARERCRPDMSHFLFVHAADLCRREGDPCGEAHALLALADNALHFCPDDVADAFAHRETLATKALQIFRRFDDGEGISRALRIKSSVTQSGTAQRLLAESLAAAEATGKPDSIVPCHVAVANRMALEGDYESATSCCRKALSLARDSGDPKLIAIALETLASVFQGDLSQRREFFDELHEIYRQLDRRASLARSLVTCAVLACEDSDYQCRTAYLQEALQLFQELDSILQTTCLDLLAGIARDQGQVERARALERQSHLIQEPTDVPEGLAEAFATGDNDGALEIVRRWFSKKS